MQNCNAALCTMGSLETFLADWFALKVIDRRFVQTPSKLFNSNTSRTICIAFMQN